MKLNGLHKGIVGKQHTIYKNNIMKMEAHEYLVSDFEKFTEYYSDIWERADKNAYSRLLFC